MKNCLGTIFGAIVVVAGDDFGAIDTPADKPAVEMDEENTMPQKTEAVNQSAAGVVVASSSVRVRSGPGTDHGTVAGLHNGDTVKIVGRNADQAWYKIELADGSNGWISSSLVELVVSGGDIPIVNK